MTRLIQSTTRNISSKPRFAWQRILRDPFALLIAFACLGLFLCSLREIGQYFYPYRWHFTVGLAIGLVGMLGRVPGIVYRPEHRCLTAFILVGALSVLISPMPEYSLARLASFLIMYVALFIGGWSWLKQGRNYELVAKLLLLTIVLGAMWSLYFLVQELPGFIPGQRVTGAFGKATGTGSFAAAGLPLVLWKVRWSQGRSRVFFLFVLGVLLYLLIFSGGRAAIIGGLAAFIVWTWKHWRSGRLAIFLTVSAIMFLFVSGVLSLDMLPDYIVREESLPTFTGRIPRWKVGLQLFMESPILGHGYGMTRYVRMYEEGERLTGVIVPGQVTLSDVIPGFGTARLGRMTLHSDHVERLMEMGILGYVPFALFWFFILRRIARLFWLPITYESSLAVALALNVAYVFLDSFMHGALFAINAPGVLIAWFGIATFMAATEKLQVYPRANLCVSSTSSTASIPVPAVLAIR